MSFSRSRKAFCDTALNFALCAMICGMGFFIIFTLCAAMKS